MSERKRRVGENESLFREVNERVLDLNDRFGVEQEQIEFVCECGHETCIERIQLTRDEYEHVRGSGRRFALVPGHELPDVETVVEDHGSFVVVEKHAGEPASLAEAEDPRSQD